MKLKNLCNFCKKELKQEVVNLGKTPLANSYAKKSEIQKKFKLHVFFCSKCLLVQHNTKLKGERIFSDYFYFSSYSSYFVNLAKKNINLLIKKYKLGESNTIVEVASNDGYLLQHIKNKNIDYYGIEPAKNISDIANRNGIKTINTYLNTNTSKKILKKNNKADLIIANNVFAHVPDIHDFIKSLKILMKNKCILCIEVPHLEKLIKYNQFDTIYHEHFYYFSLSCLKILFKKYNMKIINVDKINTHGGSLRVHVAKENNNIKINKNVNLILKNEIKHKLNKKITYYKFNKSVLNLKKNISLFMEKNKDKSIYGFGAAAKACTLINFCNLNLNSIKYIYDETPAKIGNFIPGTNIKVIKFPRKINKKIDIIIVFPWNHYNEIKAKIAKSINSKVQLVKFIPKITKEMIL